MNNSTDKPLLTVIDKPEMFDCDKCAFHVIVFRANISLIFAKVIVRYKNDK